MKAAISPPKQNAAEERIAAVRAFNRFYTQQIGLLEDGMLKSPYSLSEARVLYELGRHARSNATEIAAALNMDAGYLSRMVAKFVERDLVSKFPSPSDRRQSQLRLTAKGRRAFAHLDRGSHDIVARMLEGMSDSAQQRVVKAMGIIQGLLGGAPAEKSAYLIREHRPGDMGWVVARHAVLYNEEYGWSGAFEGLVAEIAAAFLKNYDHKRERCWIAEIDGEPVGSIFLVKDSEKIARVRLLLVEPRARGLGIGRRLVEECIRFARQCRYESITLWTHSILTAARAIYESAGFRLVDRKTHRDFGPEVTGETWDLKLQDGNGDRAPFRTTPSSPSPPPRAA